MSGAGAIASSTGLGSGLQSEKYGEQLWGQAGKGGQYGEGRSDFSYQNHGRGGSEVWGGLGKGVAGQYSHKSEEWGMGADMSRGGGSPMGNQLRGNEEMNGRQEFQAGTQHQLQLQVEELAGVVRNLAQQVSQIKVEAGGKGVIGEKNGRQDLGSSRGRDEGGKEMEVGNKGRGGLQGDWLKLRLPKYEGDILWGTYIRQVQAVFRLYGCDDDMVRAFKLIEAFRGNAISFFASLPDGVSREYGKLCEAMEGRFGDHELDSVARMKLHHVQQRQEESFVEFGGRVQALYSRGYTTGNGGEQEIVAVEYFLRGLRNKRAAFAILEKEPKSLGDAIKLVQRCEAHQTLLGGELRVRQTQETGDPSDTATLAQEGGLDLEVQMGGTLARLTGGGENPAGRGWNRGRGGANSENFRGGAVRGGNFLEDRKLGWAGGQREGNFGRADDFNRGTWGRGGVNGGRRGKIDPPQMGNPRFTGAAVRCYSCNQEGHISTSCPWGVKCFQCQGLGHVAAHCPQVRCFACHQMGHIAPRCPTARGPLN